MDWTPERIAALRKRLRYTQAEMAAALGYTRAQSISDLENGKMTPGGCVVRLLQHIDAHGDLPAPAGSESLP